VHEVRTVNSTAARAGPVGEREAYTRLTQLVSEKHRLTEEQELWQRKVERITRRLTEIDRQMDLMQRHVAEINGEQGSRSPGRAWREIELPY
jgi:hypothetical protein